MGADLVGVAGSDPANADREEPPLGSSRSVTFTEAGGATYRVALRRVPLWQVEALQADGGSEVGRELVQAAMVAVEDDGGPLAVTGAEFHLLWERWSIEDRRTLVAAAGALARGVSRIDRYLERIRTDPGFAAVLAYCVPAGIPLTHFLGGPDGWDDLSRDAALAWQADQASKCPDCRQRREDWMTPGPDGQLVELVPPPIVVEDQVCPGCAAIERASKSRSEAKEDRTGMKFTFRRRKQDRDAGVRQ